jgi:YbgC/YbaW family acyl-CoA thioester hydrolase
MITENSVERTIMWGDLDALGIVFYPRYYEWMDGCGHQFFDALGLNLGRMWQERRIQFGLVETACRYVRPGRYLQKVRIATRIDTLEPKTVTLAHRIHDSHQKELMVEGIEKRICLDVSDPHRFKALDIPEDIFTVFQKAFK